MNTVWLIRHAQSLTNAGGLAQNPHDIDLSPLGVSQSIALAERLSRDLRSGSAQLHSIFVSKYVRTFQTAQPFLAQHPDVDVKNGEHFEITYLSPHACLGTSKAQRSAEVESYWKNSDPTFLHGEGAETFDKFMQRVHDTTVAVNADLAGADKKVSAWFGHGQFWIAFLLNGCSRYDGTPKWMTLFRDIETSNPIPNATTTSVIVVPTAQLVDNSRMVEFCGPNKELRRKFLSMLSDSLPGTLEELRAAFVQDDPRMLYESIHKARPSLSVVASQEMLEALNSVDRAARDAQSIRAFSSSTNLAHMFSLCQWMRALSVSSPELDVKDAPA